MTKFFKFRNTLAGGISHFGETEPEDETEADWLLFPFILLKLINEWTTLNLGKPRTSQYLLTPYTAGLSNTKLQIRLADCDWLKKIWKICLMSNHEYWQVTRARARTHVQRAKDVHYVTGQLLLNWSTKEGYTLMSLLNKLINCLLYTSRCV